MSLSNTKNRLILRNIKVRIEACLTEIMNWMTDNKLKLNPEKTELHILSSIFRTEPIFPVLNVGSDTVTPSSHGRNIGATFDKFLTMSTHIDNVLVRQIDGKKLTISRGNCILLASCALKASNNVLICRHGPNFLWATANTVLFHCSEILVFCFNMALEKK